MTPPLSTNPEIFIHYEWHDIEPHYQSLIDQEITPEHIENWLSAWSELSKLTYEQQQRLMIATTVNTADKAAAARYQQFLEDTYPQIKAGEQTLKEKLLESGLSVSGFEITLRNLRTEAELYRKVNLPLLASEMHLVTVYDQVIGEQTVEWEGEEKTLMQLAPVLQDPNRHRRERVWRLEMSRWLADSDKMNALWLELLPLRVAIAHNAGFSSYRDYRWRQMLRFDYHPEDCEHFQEAIAEVVVPAATRIYQNRQARLGVARLRPWDLVVDVTNRPALRPFTDTTELVSKCAAIFHQVDPELGAYFQIMRQEGLLDLDNRKGKAPGGYCTELPVSARPFIFSNAVGIQEDVQTLLHEGGHAFNYFESSMLPYLLQQFPPMEFAEVASTAMEFLASPYLAAERGGFYSPADAARAQIENLEKSLLFWPYMAVVDGFQHWVYEHPEQAMDPTNCDKAWARLWRRFMPGVDWTGLETELMTGWHRKGHIFQDPFYYIEYGLAQLGAVQVWRNARQDARAAIVAYRRALSLGGSVSLPELFKTAGARLAFDNATLGEAVALMETVLEELREEIA